MCLNALFDTRDIVISHERRWDISNVETQVVIHDIDAPFCKSYTGRSGHCRVDVEFHAAFGVFEEVTERGMTSASSIADSAERP